MEPLRDLKNYQENQFSIPIMLPNCPICLDPLVANLTALSCGHIFHEFCFAQTCPFKKIEKGCRCPLCRALSVNMPTRLIFSMQQEKNKNQFSLNNLNLGSNPELMHDECKCGNEYKINISEHYASTAKLIDELTNVKELTNEFFLEYSRTMAENLRTKHELEESRKNENLLREELQKTIRPMKRIYPTRHKQRIKKKKEKKKLTTISGKKTGKKPTTTTASRKK